MRIAAGRQLIAVTMHFDIVGRCRRLAENLVGLPQLADLAFQRRHFVGNLGWDARPLAAVDFRLLHPLIKRLEIETTAAQRDG